MSKFKIFTLAEPTGDLIVINTKQIVAVQKGIFYKTITRPKYKDVNTWSLLGGKNIIQKEIKSGTYQDVQVTIITLTNTQIFVLEDLDTVWRRIDE